MPTNKARTSDNAQKQSSICPKSNSFLFCFILFFLFVLQSLFLFTCQSAFNLLYIFCWRKVLWNYTTLHKHISNSSIVGNMLLAYTTFSLKVFGLYIHARHFCRKIFCFDTDSGGGNLPMVVSRGFPCVASALQYSNEIMLGLLWNVSQQNSCHSHLVHKVRQKVYALFPVV